MKKLLPFIIAFLAFESTFQAQTYTPIATFSTGYNLDAVAENTTALANTSGVIDGSNYVLYSAFYGSLWSPAGTGLPNSGLITNGTRSYQMQPYTQNNLVYLLTTQQETITLVTPASYASLSFLAFGTEGSPSMSLTINFTDNTSQTFANITVGDWYNGTNAVIQGFDRVGRMGTTPAYVGAVNPQMYGYNFHLTCGNRAKLVKNLVILNSGTSGRLCVAAVSGAALPNYQANMTPIGCSGSTSSGTIVATGGVPAFTYTWGTSPVQTGSVATGMVSGPYTYTVNDAVGCTFTSTAIMPPTNGAQSPPAMLPYSNPVCSGQPVTFNATGAASYTWSGPSTVINGSPFSPTASGSPVVADYTVTGANSCGTSTASTVVSLTVNPNPTVTAAASVPTLCSGLSTTLTGGGASTYTWTGNVNDGVGFVPNATSTYTVRGTNVLGCISSTAITVTVVITPTAAPAVLPPAICVGSSATVTAVGTTFTWTPSAPTSGSVVVLSPATTTTYTVIKANSNCTDTKTFAIVVNPLPTVTASSSSGSVCANSAITLSATSSSPGSTYTWQPFGVTGSVVSVNPSSTTVFTTIANNGTCSGVTNITITATPIPTLTIVPSSTNVCAGSAATLTASGGINYTWSPVASGSVITVTVNGPSQYSVTANNAQGCISGTAQVLITRPVPTLNIAVSDLIVCNGLTSTLTVSGATTYTWDAVTTGATYTVNPTTLTTYTVTGTNTFSCDATATVAIDVFSPTLSVTGNTAICSGNSATLTASTANSYTWSSGGQQATTFVAPAATTVYTVNAMTTNAGGGITCPSAATFEVRVNPTPTVNVAGTYSFMCKDESMVVTASGASTYSWSNNAASTATISITPTVVASLIITVVGTSTDGCTGTGTGVIRVNPCTGLYETTAGLSLAVYPNPNTGKFTVRAEENMRLDVINSLGQLVKAISLTGANNHEVVISDLPTGVYFITGKSGNQLINKKIIIKD